MLRIVAVALLLTTALPDTAFVCRAWCATPPATERCQHADTASAAAWHVAHDCSISHAGTPGLSERTLTAMPDPRALLSCEVEPRPPVMWVMLIGSCRPADLLPHTPLETMLRI